MSARKRQPAANTGDRAIIEMEREFLAAATELDSVRRQIAKLETKTFGRDGFDHIERVRFMAAQAIESERERLAGPCAAAGLNVADDVAACQSVAAELRRQAEAHRKERQAAERKAGIARLRGQEAQLSRRFDRLHCAILRMRKVGIAGAGIQLRHLLDRDLGIATGVCSFDIPALRRVLALIEQRHGLMRRPDLYGPPRPLATHG